MTTLLNHREGAMQEGKDFKTQAASKKKQKKKTTEQVELPGENQRQIPANRASLGKSNQS